MKRMFDIYVVEEEQKNLFIDPKVKMVGVFYWNIDIDEDGDEIETDSEWLTTEEFLNEFSQEEIENMEGSITVYVEDCNDRGFPGTHSITSNFAWEFVQTHLEFEKL